jgi:heat-inducible transcriptional repressor
MDVPVPLDSRKQQILKAVVADYTETGVPVGSQALAARHLVTWSAATIRNELANLVDVGYLLQPHTSAGRIPSDRGYRYYVDFLMEEESVSAAIRRQVDPNLPQHAMGVEELLEAAAQVLALITDSVSIVTGPRALAAKMKHLDLVSLDPRHLLIVLLLEGNLLRQQVVEVTIEADQAALSGLASRLNEQLAGLAVEEVEGRPAGTPEADRLGKEVLGHLLAVMAQVDARQDTVVVHDGVRNLLHQPEFGDVERLQQVLDIVEEERALSQLLTSLEVDKGVHIVIGAENEFEQLRACSLVLTTYRAGDTRRGTIGVLGPTRMRYSQVAPRLRYVSLRVGQALDRMLG